MAKPVLVVHPTCASSWRLVKGLKALGLLDRVELVVAEKPVGKLVWSVPWLEIDGEPVAADPLDAEEAAAILEARWSRSVEPLQAFEEALLHSAYASSLVAVWGVLDPVLDHAFLSAALRSRLSGLRPETVAGALKGQRLSDSLADRVARALAVSLVRDLWWGLGGELSETVLEETLTRGFVASWLIARASIGRVGLPTPPRPDRRVVEALIGFAKRNARGLVSRVEREQRQILEDREYLELLGVTPRS